MYNYNRKYLTDSKTTLMALKNKRLIINLLYFKPNKKRITFYFL